MQWPAYFLIFGVCIMAHAANVSANGQLKGASGDAGTLAVEVLKELHNLGADMYNGGDAIGCVRTYQAALIAVRPFLLHMPAIQKIIDEGLAGAKGMDVKGDRPAEKTPTAKRQAFYLHEIIEQVRTELKAVNAWATPAPPSRATANPT